MSPAGRVWRNHSNPGHTLVVARQHVRDVFDIDEETTAAVMRATVRVARAIKAALQPDGVNLFQASGRAAFQSVFHFHIYVVPRWWDDDLKLPWRPTPGDPSAVRKVAARIREHVGEEQ